MKLRAAICVLLALSVSTASTATWAQVTAKAQLNRNAALAYWRAFSSMPDLDDEQRALVADVADKQAPVTEAAIEIATRSANSLKDLHRATQIPDCAWGTVLEDGPNALLTHLAETRRLARLACLRARVRFHQGNERGAVEDLMAVMILGHHVGDEGLLISLLVEYAVQSQAIRQLAQQLPAMEAPTRKELAEALANLPQGKTMVDATRVEKEVLLEWFIRTLEEPNGYDRVFTLFEGQENENVTALQKLPEAELLQTAKDLRPIYDRIIKLMALAPDELDAKVKQLGEKSLAEGPVRNFAGIMLPGVVSCRRNEAVHQARLSMLECGIAVLAEGTSALGQDAHRDPFGTGPFTYVKRDKGFQLASVLKDRKKEPVTLTFGE